MDNTIPLRQTESAHDLSHLLDVFDAPTRAALRTAVRELGSGTAGHGRDINDALGVAPQLLSDVGTISSTLSSRKADLAGLLHNGERVVSRFHGRNESIRRLLTRTRSTLAAVNVDGAKPLKATLRRLPDTLREAQTALDALHRPLADVRTAVTILRPGAESLGQATGNLRGVLREAPRTLRKFPGVAEQAKPAVDELTQTFGDVRSFVPRLADGLASAKTPLAVLAPYAGDAATLADNIGRAFEPHDGFMHQLRIALVSVPSTATVSGAGPVSEQPSNPYPGPGEAIRDRDPNGGVIPGGSGS